MRRTALSTFLFLAILGLGCMGVSTPGNADEHCEDMSDPNSIARSPLPNGVKLPLETIGGSDFLPRPHSSYSVPKHSITFTLRTRPVGPMSFSSHHFRLNLHIDTRSILKLNRTEV